MAVADLRGDVVGQALAAFDASARRCLMRSGHVRRSVADTLQVRRADGNGSGCRARRARAATLDGARSRSTRTSPASPGSMARGAGPGCLLGSSSRPTPALAQRWRGGGRLRRDAVLLSRAGRASASRGDWCAAGPAAQVTWGSCTWSRASARHSDRKAAAPRDRAPGAGKYRRRRPPRADRARCARHRRRTGRGGCSRSSLTLLDPQVIVLGGAIAAAGDVLMAPLRHAYAGALHERPLRATPTLAASPLAERGTVLGACSPSSPGGQRLIDLDPVDATMGRRPREVETVSEGRAVLRRADSGDDRPKPMRGGADHSCGT